MSVTFDVPFEIFLVELEMNGVRFRSSMTRIMFALILAKREWLPFCTYLGLIFIVLRFFPVAGWAIICMQIHTTSDVISITGFGQTCS